MRKRMEELRKLPITSASFPVLPGYDADAHVAWKKEQEDAREDPWDRVQRERRER